MTQNSLFFFPTPPLSCFYSQCWGLNPGFCTYSIPRTVMAFCSNKADFKVTFFFCPLTISCPI